MTELKCPKCGNAFTVNEADYASIVNQIKNSEFESEVCRRINELKAQQAAEQQVKDAKKNLEISKALSFKDMEIARLTNAIQLKDAEKDKAGDCGTPQSDDSFKESVRVGKECNQRRI